MKRTRLVRTLITLTMMMLASVAASAQTSEPRIEVKVTPAQSVEERVANDLKEKDLRKAAEEKRIAQEAARLADMSPKALLSRARILYVRSNTDYFETVQLQNALRKRSEIDGWQIAMIDGWDKQNVADTEIEIDRPLFTFTFTYKITNRSTGISPAAGKVNAWDGNAQRRCWLNGLSEIRRAR